MVFILKDEMPSFGAEERAGGEFKGSWEAAVIR